VKNVENRILVTGGAGFIGTHLVNQIIDRGLGSDVVLEIVDDLSSASMSPQRLDFLRYCGILFRCMTVEDFQPPAGVRYRQIYHLACKVGPAHVLKYAGRMATEIINDAMKMADLALRDNAPLISISTSEVYGRDPHGVPQKEDASLEVPARFTARLEYAVGKLMTEISLINLAAVHPLRVNLIRPFNIVGPHQTGEGGFVLPRFVEAALRNQPLTVFGDGNQLRAFTHVGDLVDALLLIMDSTWNQGIYNVGSPENVCTIAQLARRVIEITGSSSEIHYVDPRTIYGPMYSEAPDKFPDISRIKNRIGWRSTWSLDEIIEDYAKFVRAGRRLGISAVA
jgi:UDP-glucose 4-epimerase